MFALPVINVPPAPGRRLLAMRWARARVRLPNRSPATWNYGAFKAPASCPSEIH